MPGSDFLLPLVWLGSISDFQVANLLPATPNFEPCKKSLFSLFIAWRVKLLSKAFSLYHIVPTFKDLQKDTF